MSSTLHVDINPDIELDETKTKGMPDDIKSRLLATMTMACDKYECEWTELTWKVKPDGVIYVKRKQDVT